MRLTGAEGAHVDLVAETFPARPAGWWVLKGLRVEVDVHLWPPGTCRSSSAFEPLVGRGPGKVRVACFRGEQPPPGPVRWAKVGCRSGSPPPPGNPTRRPGRRAFGALPRSASGASPQTRPVVRAGGGVAVDRK